MLLCCLHFTRTFPAGKVGKESSPFSAEKIPKCVSLSPEALLQTHVEIWNMYCCHQWLPLLCGMTQTGVQTFKIMRLHNACDLATLLLNKTPDLEPWFSVICQSVFVPLGLHEISAIFPQNICRRLSADKQDRKKSQGNAEVNSCFLKEKFS